MIRNETNDFEVRCNRSLKVGIFQAVTLSVSYETKPMQRLTTFLTAFLTRRLPFTHTRVGSRMKSDPFDGVPQSVFVKDNEDCEAAVS